MYLLFDKNHQFRLFSDHSERVCHMEMSVHMVAGVIDAGMT